MSVPLPLPPLAVAAARGDVEALAALLAEGIDINSTTRSQPRTCLMEACKGNADRAVDWIISRG
jgi:ankyrin repeat protein